MVTTVDRFGRIVIPKRIREELNLRSGSSVDVGIKGDQVVLMPVGKGPALRKKGRVWVLCGGYTEEDPRTALERLRAERDLHVLGMRRP